MDKVTGPAGTLTPNFWFQTEIRSVESTTLLFLDYSSPLSQYNIPTGLKFPSRFPPPSSLLPPGPLLSSLLLLLFTYPPHVFCNGSNFPTWSTAWSSWWELPHLSNNHRSPLSSSSLTLTHSQSFEGLHAHSIRRGTFLGSKDIAERWGWGGHTE